MKSQSLSLAKDEKVALDEENVDLHQQLSHVSEKLSQAQIERDDVRLELTQASNTFQSQVWV